MRYLTVFFFLIVVSELLAQDLKTINQRTQSWWSINSTTRFTNKFGMVSDFHIRSNGLFEENNFYFTRIGAAYWTSDKLTLVGGYAHLWLSVPAGDSDFFTQNENRIYQQAQWRHQEGRVVILNRIRNEQRWHEVLDDGGEVDRIRFSNRVRILLSLSVPVFTNEYLPSLSFAEEMHVQFGKELVYNTFDQNRIFAGIKQKITHNLRFDLGYMMVYQQRLSGSEYDMNHTFRWFFYYTPDLRKNKDGLHYPVPGDE